MVKPILFNTMMVQAIMEGRKVVTRRMIKPQPGFFFDHCGKIHDPDNQEHIAFVAIMPDDHEEIYIPPYQPGDILYVRETWRVRDCTGDYADGTKRACIEFKAGGDTAVMYPKSNSFDKWRTGARWHPSLHMPKEAARIFLKVKSVRVERLQDMTEADALNEGVPDEWPMDPVFCPACKGEGLVGAFHPVTLGYMDVECPHCEKAVTRFANLWNSTIKRSDLPAYGWDANPWVWVIEFERCEKQQEVEQ